MVESHPELYWFLWQPEFKIGSLKPLQVEQASFIPSVCMEYIVYAKHFQNGTFVFLLILPLIILTL